MYYELLRADAQNKAYIDFTTDSVMLEVADYYNHHGTDNEKMRAYYLLGCTYRDLKDVPTELQYFQTATEKADTTQKDCDLYTLYAVYSQMADIYHGQYLPEEELKAWDLCGRIAKLDNDTISAIDAFKCRMHAYYFMDKPDTVLDIIEKARERYLKVGLKKNAAVLLDPAISILLDRGETIKAKRYIDIFKKESGYFSNDTIATPRAYLHYRSLGRYALLNNQLDSARYYFDKLLKHDKKEAAYQGLLALYEKTGQADSVLKYSRLYADANDSSFLNNNSNTVAQMTAMFNYGRQKHNAETAKTQLLVEKSRSMTYLIILFVFIVATALLYRINKKKHRHTIEKIKELNQEIQHKASLLSEAMANNNEEELRVLKASLEDMQQTLEKYKMSDALAAFMENDIYKLFYKVGTSGSNKITTSEWETMANAFNSAFGRYTAFIHSGKSMTEDQIKVCMLMRLGFGENEMKNILDVDHKRYASPHF